MIYLDYNSTTPIDAQVLDVMNETYKGNYGNPSSTHLTGSQARDLIEQSRSQVADLINAGAHDVIFTSGATEANNMVVSWLASDVGNKRILYGATEHKSVIQPCQYMAETFGLEAVTIPVTHEGIIDMQKYREILEESHTDIVSIMAVNSETGTINPILEIASLAHEYGAIFHCDVTQAIGKIPFDMTESGVDIVTMSSHKIYGPKGVGALVAPRNIRKQITPLIHGGGQESNLRSGTENVPGIAGFAKACSIAKEYGLADSERQKLLRDRIENSLKSSLGGVTVNGADAERVPNTTNIRIAGALADAVMVNMQKVEISTGSACSSSTMEPSHVLVAMGLNRDEADECIRISVGRPTTEDEINKAIPDIVQAVNYVRSKEAEIMKDVRQC